MLLSATYAAHVSILDRYALMCKSVSPDPEQRSAGEVWPLQGKRSSADISDGHRYQKHAAIISHHSLLPYK